MKDILDKIFLEIGNFRKVTGIKPDTLFINPYDLKEIVPYPIYDVKNAKCFGLSVERSMDMKKGEFKVTASLSAFN